MQIKFESCLGLGRRGRAGRGEVGRPSRSIKESRKRLAGAYSNGDKGQARTAPNRPGSHGSSGGLPVSDQSRLDLVPKYLEYVHSLPSTLDTYCR